MNKIGILGIVVSVLLTACATLPPPSNVNNLCSIFRQYPDWYRATQDVSVRWRVPVTVQMAIMHQESKFDANACQIVPNYCGLSLGKDLHRRMDTHKHYVVLGICIGIPVAAFLHPGTILMMPLILLAGMRMRRISAHVSLAIIRTCSILPIMRGLAVTSVKRI